jgi:hypothetical protein
MTTCLVALLSWVSLLVAPASAKSVISLQVSDYRDRPIMGVVLSVRNNGSLSHPTDVAGKTEIIIPQKIQPGERIALLLVAVPSKDLQFLAPWEGRATVPQPTDSIEVVLGKVGDPVVLTNSRVLASLAESVNSNGDASPVENFSVERSLNALKRIADTLIIDPSTIDSAIRNWAKSSKDSKLNDTKSKYLANLPANAVLSLDKGRAELTSPSKALTLRDLAHSALQLTSLTLIL